MAHRTTTLSLVLVVTAAALSLSSSLTGHGLSLLQGGRANNGTGPVSCWPHERDALLEFKRGITSDPADILASWQPGEQQDCCLWRGIRCSSRTGHVISIHLHNVRDNYQLIWIANETALVGQISPSLLSLQHLKHLDLSLNKLEGPTRRFPEFLGSLNNLRYLNLSSIPFNGRVPPQLGNLTKLRNLDLSARFALGSMSTLYSTNISWLTGLPSLQYLNMRSLNLSMAHDWAYVVSKMPSLRILDLTDCMLTSANQSLPHLNLTRLERLDLSMNDFQHPIASCWFWNLTGLSYLGLGGTYLYGRFHHDAFGGMTPLEVLDLQSSDGSNDPYITDGGLDIMTANMTNLCNLKILVFTYSNFRGNITELFNHLPQCSPSKLRKLHLDNNNFAGAIPNWIGRWASLQIFDLSNNILTGPLPSEIGMLNSLLSLDLSNNIITGPLPSEIGMLNSLLSLDLSYNLIMGPVPSEISMLTNLTALYLGSNNLSGVITQEFLSGLTTSLTAIEMSRNFLKIAVDPDWMAPFSLQYADFACCEMGPRFPTWLQSQIEVIYLDISGAAISDNLPPWFGTAFSNAVEVNISHNGVNGKLPTNMEAMKSLETLDLNSNNLTGQIPRFPDTLGILDISRNSLSGPLPANFGAPYITDLRIFSNRITGHVPKSMCQMQFSLGILDLSDNLLEGEFPECFHPEGFSMLILSNNQFSGKFPPSLQKCTELFVLDLDSNNFSGGLPMWIGEMVNLEIVRLGHNNFSGGIPGTITNLTNLLHLDLAANSISGHLPRNLSNLSGMTARGYPTTIGKYYVPILNLSVITKGDERYYAESVVFNMVFIDLSSNFLTGEIPEEITSLDTVISLNFSRNRLSGKIPVKIGVMQALESLDLSENKLYGELPQSLSNLTYLSYLDLAYNDLTGTIPSGGQLDTLYAEYPFMYDGNSGLCGHPLPKNCSADNSGPQHGDQKGGPHDSKLVSFPSGLGVGFVVGLWIVFCIILFKKSWRIAYFQCFDKALDEIYVFLVTWGDGPKRRLNLRPIGKVGHQARQLVALRQNLCP